MRITHCLFLIGVSATALMVGTISAQAGNVLVPTDSNSAAPTTDIGIVPSAPAATSTTSNTNSAAPKPSLFSSFTSLFSSSSTASTVNNQTPKAVSGQTYNIAPPPPGQIATKNGLTPQMQAYITAVKAQADERYQAMMPKIPPILMNEPDEIPTWNKVDATTHVNTTFDRSYSFSSSDLTTLQSALGYSPAQVQSSCIPRVTLSYTSSSGRTSARLYPSVQKTLDIAGPVTAVNVATDAYCYPPANLPSSGTVVYKTNDGRYVVSLMGASSCPTPIDGSSNLYLQYTSGRLNCFVPKN